MIPKFRAWDKEGNRMILPKYLYSIDLLKEQVTERTECNYTFSLYSIPFDKVELMQSTGLKDKNGKEIFEGDILTDGHTTGDIRNHPTLGFYIVDESSKEGYLSDTVGIEDFEEAKEFMRNSIEVIGNIYENPELLESEVE
nr:MAG TPA: YopX protein [Caudoviricetes sp.]